MHRKSEREASSSSLILPDKEYEALWYMYKHIQREENISDV